jgi:hypothetical protein
MKADEFKNVVKYNKDDFQLCFTNISELKTTKTTTKLTTSKFHKTKAKKVTISFKDICRLY